MTLVLCDTHNSAAISRVDGFAIGMQI